MHLHMHICMQGTAEIFPTYSSQKYPPRDSKTLDEWKTPSPIKTYRYVGGTAGYIGKVYLWQYLYNLIYIYSKTYYKAFF